MLHQSIVKVITDFDDFIDRRRFDESFFEDLGY